MIELPVQSLAFLYDGLLFLESLFLMYYLLEKIKKLINCSVMSTIKLRFLVVCLGVRGFLRDDLYLT